MSRGRRKHPWETPRDRGADTTTHRLLRCARGGGTSRGRAPSSRESIPRSPQKQPYKNGTISVVICQDDIVPQRPTIAHCRLPNSDHVLRSDESGHISGRCSFCVVSAQRETLYTPTRSTLIAPHLPDARPEVRCAKRRPGPRADRAAASGFLPSGPARPTHAIARSLRRPLRTITRVSGLISGVFVF